MGREYNIGIVFSGGGSRGSYQIGVWQALLDLGIAKHIRAVYGTSVGAINGAALVQNDIQMALDIWHEINFSKVFANFQNDQGHISKRKMYLEWMRGAIRNKGINVSPLKELLREVINEDLIRKSPLDYGMVVFELNKRRARYLIKEEIPKGQLTEYIIASSTFPIFQPHRIEDTLFIDGGIYDNRPVKFFKGKDQFDKIIVVDVTMARHIWPRKRMRNQVDIYYVRPSRLLGSPLAFRHKRIMANLELGYTNALDQLSDFLD